MAAGPSSHAQETGNLMSLCVTATVAISEVLSTAVTAKQELRARSRPAHRLRRGQVSANRSLKLQHSRGGPPTRPELLNSFSDQEPLRCCGVTWGSSFARHYRLSSPPVEVTVKALLAALRVRPGARKS
jgi:hypothetical protein